mgnify:FL=1
MSINIDEEILELLDFLNVSKDKKEFLINILLIEGIEATVSNEEFLASKKTKKIAKIKVANLKVKYILKMMEVLSRD